ncbi:MAG: hypothetical protein ACRD2L_00170, partial [Terriglobia bacterium]
IGITALKNIDKIFAINDRIGKEMIEVRHFIQPLRTFVVDDRFLRMKEVKEVDHYAPGELAKRTCIFYEVYDKDWIEWVQKVFWNMFRNGTPAKKRVECIQEIQNLTRST